MFFEDFQDGCHFGYRNGTILAILNFYVTPMPPIKYQLSQTWGLEGYVIILKYFKLATMVAILDIGMERF